MKAIIVLLGILGLALAGVYYLGGYSSFDPDKQGNEARARITPGMTWQQVVSVAGDHPKYQSIGIVKIGKTERPKEGPEVDFDPARLAGRIQNNEVPSGFNLVYRFSEKVAYKVIFDGAGKVIAIEDVPTIADLLHTR